MTDQLDINRIDARNNAAITIEELANRLAYIETAKALLIANATEFRAATHISAHKHSRNQLLFPSFGMVSVSTTGGHWLVPTGKALWIPAGVVHAVDMIGNVQMHSVHVMTDAIPNLPNHLHVATLTPLLRQLVYEAEEFDDQTPAMRCHYIIGAILQEMLCLKELPLQLPLPTSPRLSRLCQLYLEQPLSVARIDDWARASGMSRRSFTRTFRAETGLSLSDWRQQACLLAALPKLSNGESVTSVAFDLGYDSAPAFTAMFTRILGRPPLAYVRAMQREN